MVIVSHGGGLQKNSFLFNNTLLQLAVGLSNNEATRKRKLNRLTDSPYPFI